MGVYYIKETEGPAELGIWKIIESRDELLQQVHLSPEEEEVYASFRTVSRQKQWLAYRCLIREIISPRQHPVHYDESGKPFLAGSHWHISVTHTGDYAGVILSRKVKVGIDMEKIRSRIDRVKERFLSDEELKVIPADNPLEHLTLVWCAKEAVYKLYGLRNLDFRKDIRVEPPISTEEDRFYTEVTAPAGISRYTLHREKKGDLMVVWAIDMM